MNVDCRKVKRDRLVDGKWIRAPAREMCFECLFNLRKDVHYKGRRSHHRHHCMKWPSRRKLKRLFFRALLHPFFSVSRASWRLNRSSERCALITEALSNKVSHEFYVGYTLVYDDFYQFCDFSISLPCYRKKCNQFTIRLIMGHKKINSVLKKGKFL